jgi:tRNA A37 methylthiotransferase MiaB
LLRRQTLSYHRSRVGSSTEVLVAGRSRHARQLAGRDPWHRVVNLDAAAFPDAAPGRLVRVQIAEATPHSLLGEPITALPLAQAGIPSGAVAIRR